MYATGDFQILTNAIAVVSVPIWTNAFARGI